MLEETVTAQSLLNKKVGEEVEFEMDGQKKHYRVDAVEPAVSQANSASSTAEAAHVS